MIHVECEENVVIKDKSEQILRTVRKGAESTDLFFLQSITHFYSKSVYVSNLFFPWLSVMLDTYLKI